MQTITRSGLVVLAFLACGCLPPPYDPQPGERFWSMVVAEQWTRDDSAMGTTTRNETTHSAVEWSAWNGRCARATWE